MIMTREIQVFDGRGNEPWPTTVKDSVDRLYTMLKEDNQLEDFKKVLREGQGLDADGKGHVPFHFGLGRWIRNNFGLWQENKPLLADCTVYALQDPDLVAWMKENKTDQVHPDDASSMILKELIKVVEAGP